MKGNWKVNSNTIDGKKMYMVCRVIDTTQPEHSGNQEYAPEFNYTEDLQKAREYASELNMRNDR